MAKSNGSSFWCPRVAKQPTAPPFYWVDGRRCSACGSLRPDVVIAAIEGGELLHQDRPSRTYLVGDEPVDFAHFGDGHRAKFRDLFATRRVVMPLHEPAPPLPTYLLPHL